MIGKYAGDYRSITIDDDEIWDQPLTLRLENN